MIAPTSGEVSLLGEDVVHLRDHHRADVRRRLVGFVFQELGLVPGMTLEENVLLPLVPTGGATAAEAKRIDALLERFGLSPRRRARAGSLSGGERQRGAIVRALVRDPPILFLDEPTAHVDAEAAASVLDHLASLAAEGRTIVATTHDPRLATHAGVTRTLAMRDGKLTEAAAATP
jgi:putative ABC transport system ATP-binding protein